MQVGVELGPPPSQLRRASEPTPGPPRLLPFSVFPPVAAQAIGPHSWVAHPGPPIQNPPLVGDFRLLPPQLVLQAEYRQNSNPFRAPVTYGGPPIAPSEVPLSLSHMLGACGRPWFQ